MKNVTVTLDEREAMARYQSRQPVVLKHAGGYPSREEVHARDGLR